MNILYEDNKVVLSIDKYKIVFNLTKLGYIDVPVGTYFFGKRVEEEEQVLQALLRQKIIFHQYFENELSCVGDEYRIGAYTFSIVNPCHSHTHYFVKVSSSDGPVTYKFYKNKSAIKNFIANLKI